VFGAFKSVAHAYPCLWFKLFSSMMFQTLSSWATSSVEEVASTGPGIRFFQLYVSYLKSLLYILKTPVTLDGSYVMIFE